MKSTIGKIKGSRILVSEPCGLTALIAMAKAGIKASFFDRLRFGRVGAPDRAANGLLIASLLDLMAATLKALHDRIEPKDYIDIDCLIGAGLSLADGTSASLALFPESNELWTVKTLTWFDTPELRKGVPAIVRKWLRKAATEWRQRATPIGRASFDLSEATGA